MNATLAAWNAAGEAAARNAMMACCGAKRWGDAMVALRPITSVFALSEAADRVWGTMQEGDWLEAFACHPRIGERRGIGERKVRCTWANSRPRGLGLSKRRRARRAKTCWPRLPREIRHTKSDSASLTSCAPRAKARKRCWRFSSGGWGRRAKPSCARPPSSSGRSCRFV